MFRQSKQHRALSSFGESNTSKLNTLVDRDIDDQASPSDMVNFHTFDTEFVNLPVFMEEFVKNTYNYSDEEYEKDILAGELLANTDMAFHFKNEILAMKSTLAKDTSEIGMADFKEVNKMQALIGAPILHTPSVEGSHPFWEDIPHTFKSFDWSWVKSAGVWMREKFNPDQNMDYTLPRSTSQGILLKTPNDGKEWRITCKVIQALIASKFKNPSDLYAFNDLVQELYDKFGLDNPVFDALVGIRRQQSSKDEPVQIEGSSFSGDFEEPHGVTKGVQGRVRAIFMLNELLKAYHKRPHEIIKKTFFSKCNCFLTHPGTIFSKQTSVILKTITQGRSLITSDGWETFSDLSQYDRTQHRGFYDISYDFIEGIVVDFDSKYGREVMADLSVIMPSNAAEESSVIRQKIKGRSRLSGEPGVTTINNIVQILANSQAIGLEFNVHPLDVFKHMCCPSETPVGSPIKHVIEHFHGDDAFRWLGSDLEIYKRVNEHISLMGLVSKPEDGPIYLKKVPKWYTHLCHLHPGMDERASIINDKQGSDDYSTVKNIVDSFESSKKVKKGQFINTEVGGIAQISLLDSTSFSHLFDVSGSVSERFEFSSEKGWNVNHLFSGLLGSIMKNRFGEYPSKDKDIFVFSLLDTIDALDIYLLNEDYHLSPMWQLISTVSSHTLTDAEIKSESSRLKIKMEFIQKVLDEHGENQSSKELDRMLDRLYYSRGETLLSDSMLEMYGTTQMNPIEEGEKLGLTKLTLDQLQTLLIHCQEHILENNGGSPKHLLKMVEDYKTRLEF
jgi:hypothetical protein